MPDRIDKYYNSMVCSYMNNHNYPSKMTCFWRKYITFVAKFKSS